MYSHQWQISQHGPGSFSILWRQGFICPSTESRVPLSAQCSQFIDNIKSNGVTSSIISLTTRLVNTVSIKREAVFFSTENYREKFQRIMVMCFDDIPGVFIYLDDIVICGNTIEEHNANLRAFLQRCRELNVSPNSKKCSFGQSELNWLGYVISEGTFKPDPERTKSLKEYKEPTNMKEVERFLGMANYYSKFVSSFAELASSLQDLKNSGQFQWSSRLANTFRAVKAATLDSFLAVPYFNQEFVLQTDASGIALAGVLTQHGRPVAVASKRLSTAEQSWSAVELEALAIVHCASNFRQF